MVYNKIKDRRVVDLVEGLELQCRNYQGQQTHRATNIRAYFHFVLNDDVYRELFNTALPFEDFFRAYPEEARAIERNIKDGLRRRIFKI